MGIMDSIASMATSYSQAQVATGYSLALTKKMMDTTEELALKELQQMMPPSPYTFDVYA
ncbi:YjfB family protein [Acutalibacter caecimuris]|uniref:YjfB family protein n=1 Tax=Acutalibacter caecimuris TaxID=3093657 RepID=UPI002AC97B27|nr:YjfB family protein [Acutalibacter sp. M00118]